MSLVIRVDASRVLRAIELARSTSSRSLPKLLSSTAFHVAKHAYRLTDPLPQGRIDSALELDVTTAVRTRKVKRGLKYIKSPHKKLWWGAPLSKAASRQAPLGVLIIMARHRPGSDYNVLTDNRWRLANPLPTGKGTKLARQHQIYTELMRMVKGRHSSTGFLRKGWSDCMKRIKQNGFGGDVIDVGAIEYPDKAHMISPLSAVSAGGSGASYWLQIENTIGTSGTPNLSARRNFRLIERGSGPLNAALAIQAAEMESRYLPRLGAKLKAAWEAV